MKIWMWIIFGCLLLPSYAGAQRQTEYNRRGDEAMKRNDYRDAKMWYEEGVSYCDQYSIHQLTEIWLKDETMHVSMRTVMSKCLNCLNEYATERDTSAIQKLILYYTQGIGTSENRTTAGYWRKQLEDIRRSNALPPTLPKKPKEPMRFFAGYDFSLLAPYGIRVGGVNSLIGWYVKLYSDLSFQGHNEECRIDGNRFVIENMQQYYGSTGKTKANVMMGSVGIMVRTVENLYTSLGAGYWQRDVLREYEIVNDEGIIQSTGWAKDRDSSKKGFKIDLDATYFLKNKRFYVSGGCSAFNFKYFYPNAGVGLVF